MHLYAKYACVATADRHRPFSDSQWGALPFSRRPSVGVYRIDAHPGVDFQKPDRSPPRQAALRGTGASQAGGSDGVLSVIESPLRYSAPQILTVAEPDALSRRNGRISPRFHIRHPPARASANLGCVNKLSINPPAMALDIDWDYAKRPAEDPPSLGNNGAITGLISVGF